MVDRSEKRSTFKMK